MPEQKRVFPYKPQINISIPSTTRMWFICGCAFLCILQSSLNDSGRSLILAFITLFSALLTEFILTWKEFKFSKIKDGSAAATALILTLLSPNLINPFFSVCAAVFAIVVVKYSFGGLGSNWLNPALGGWIFIRFSWPSAFSKALSNSEYTVIEMNKTSQLSVFDNNVTEVLNHSFFSVLDVQLPSGYIDLLFSSSSGIIADRGLFFLLIGTLIITAIGINRGWIPLVFLLIYGFLIRFAGGLNGAFGSGDLIYGLFSGGTIVTAFIIAAEPASSAKLKYGIIFTVILAAVLSWFFRYVCGEFFGCLIAVALMNCFTPVICFLEEKIFLSYKNRDKFQESIL